MYVKGESIDDDELSGGGEVFNPLSSTEKL